MYNEKDYVLPFLGIVGLVSVVYAIKITVEEISGRFSYIFLLIQGLIVIYLSFILITKLREAWTEYRWSPDRLK